MNSVLAETRTSLVWLEDTAAVQPAVLATKPLCWATLSNKVLPALLPTASDAMLLPVKPKLLLVTDVVSTLIEPWVVAVMLVKGAVPTVELCTLVTAKSALTVAVLPVALAATSPVPVLVAVLAVTSNLLPATLPMESALYP